MNDATSYIVDQEGIIYNQDGVVLRHAPDFVTACESTKNYIKNTGM